MPLSQCRFMLITLVSLIACAGAPAADAQTRAIVSLQNGWRFMQGAKPGDVPSAAFDAD
jgi:hypothetical protein